MRREEDDLWRTSFWTDPLNWLWNKPQEWRHRLRFRHNPSPGPGFEPAGRTMRHFCGTADQSLFHAVRKKLLWRS